MSRPSEVISTYHELFVDACLKMGLTFDWYTHTDTENHWQVTQQMFLRHLENGYLYTDVQKQLFDPTGGPFSGRPLCRGHLSRLWL